MVHSLTDTWLKTWTIFFYVVRYSKEIHLQEERFDSINLTVRKHTAVSQTLLLVPAV